MSSRRLLKAAEAIREVVSMGILTELRDPRVRDVTVTKVEVAPDMRSAKVLVSIMGEEGRQHLCLRGLQNSSGFLQSLLAKRIDTRYTPRLTFEIDDGVKKSLEVNRILNELARQRAAQAGDPTTHPAEDVQEGDEQGELSPDTTSHAPDTSSIHTGNSDT